LRTATDSVSISNPAAARAADALVAVAETAMAAGPQPCEGGDRNKVSLVIVLGLLLGR
jgi:hypothetical protein